MREISGCGDHPTREMLDALAASPRGGEPPEMDVPFVIGKYIVVSTRWSCVHFDPQPGSRPK